MKGQVEYHAGKYEGTPDSQDHLISGVGWQHFLVFDRAVLGRCPVILDKSSWWPKPTSKSDWLINWNTDFLITIRNIYHSVRDYVNRVTKPWDSPMLADWFVSRN